MQSNDAILKFNIILNTWMQRVNELKGGGGGHMKKGQGRQILKKKLTS